jgi:Double zinc ribbon
MRCPTCGQENPAEAKFCGKCATRLAPADLPPPSRPVVPTAPGEVTQGMKVGVIIGSIVLPLLGIIMGLIYMNDPSPAKKAVGKIWLFVGIGAVAFWCICTMIAGGLQNL